MPWTNWRKVAEGRRWFGEELDWDGPAAMQNRLLDRFDYDWNIQLNTWGKQ